MSDDEIQETQRIALAGTFRAVERIRIGVLAMYGCSIGVLFAVWPPSTWVWFLFALQTVVLVVLSVWYFPIYTLGEAISANEPDDDEK